MVTWPCCFDYAHVQYYHIYVIISIELVEGYFTTLDPSCQSMDLHYAPISGKYNK